jgi:hypothetical protein
VPPRRGFLLNVKINAAMLYDRLPRPAKHTTAVYRLTSLTLDRASYLDTDNEGDLEKASVQVRTVTC